MPCTGIVETALRMGLQREELVPYGDEVVKVRLLALPRLAERRSGRLILVTAMTPTPLGEGKTTTAIGLGDALGLLGHKVSIALREPSLALAFGMKGAGTGGGRARVIPSTEINLHFTGDFHAVEAAHNLLAAAVDEHLYRGGSPRLDPWGISWPRAIGVNDRALRRVIVGLGGEGNGVPRQAGFEAVACSEIMSILCLATGYRDLRERLSRIVVGFTPDRKGVTAGALGVAGPLGAVLGRALAPNLARTLGGTPAFIHGGPYANVALGCNSVLATRMALHLADYVLTEAGGSADTGGEKFVNLKCRIAGLRPSAAVVVASVRALKRQGSAGGALAEENLPALGRGFGNLLRHVEIMRSFGIPPVVAINRFVQDTPREIEAVLGLCREAGLLAAVSTVWAEGGPGGLELGKLLMDVLAGGPPALRLSYPDEASLQEKLDLLATRVYGAAGVDIQPRAAARLDLYEREGYGSLPLCVARPHTSTMEGRMVVTNAALAAGAGFVTAYTGNLTAQPALPKRFAGSGVDLEDDGTVRGLG